MYALMYVIRQPSPNWYFKSPDCAGEESVYQSDMDQVVICLKISFNIVCM